MKKLRLKEILAFKRMKLINLKIAIKWLAKKRPLLKTKRKKLVNLPTTGMKKSQKIMTTGKPQKAITRLRTWAELVAEVWEPTRLII